MADGVALKPRLELGQYRGRWSVPDEAGTDQQLDGDLELTAGRTPTASIWGKVPLVMQQLGQSTMASFPQRFSHPVIAGELRSGPTVLLLDADVETWHHDQAFVSARAALVGPPRAVLDGPLAFNRITVQISGLDAYAGIGPIKSFTFPTDAQSFYDHSWQVQPNRESKQKWSDPDATITITWFSAVAQESAFFRMAFSPVIAIDLLEPCSLDDCLELWIEPLRRVISLATGRAEDITYLSIGRPGRSGRHDEFQVFGHKLDQAPFATRDNVVRKIKTAFRANSEDASPLQLLRAWQRLRDEHHPLLETYGASIVLPRQHPRSTYLLLVQALEGLYGHEHQNDHEERVAAYRIRRDEALTAIAEVSDLPSSTLNFLKRYLMRKPPSGLDECFLEMFRALPYDVSDELIATPLVQQMKDSRGRAMALPVALRTVRNELSHGTRGYEAENLFDVVQILDRVTRAHMLRVLGCGTDAQDKAARGDRL